MNETNRTHNPPQGRRQHGWGQTTMATAAALALLLCASGCRDSADEPEALKLPAWAPVGPSSSLPEPRSAVIAWAYPHELPERPRPLLAATAAAPRPMPWTSGRSIAMHHDRLYVVDSDNGALVIMNPDAQESAIERIVAVGPRPAQVVVGPNGDAYVSVSHGGVVARLKAGADTVETLYVGTMPMGLALSTAADVLYVAVAGEGNLVAIDTASLQVTGGISGLDRPRAVAVDPRGHVLVTQRGDTVAVFEPGDGGFNALSTFDTRLRYTAPPDDLMHPDRLVRLTVNRANAATIHPESGAFLVTHEQILSGLPEDAPTMAGWMMEKDGNPLPEPEGEKPNEEEYPSEESVFNRDPSTRSGNTFIWFIGDSQMPQILRPVEAVVSVVTDGDRGDQTAYPVQDRLSLEPLAHLISTPSDINHHPTWALAFVTGFGSDSVLVLNTATPDPLRSPVAIIEVGMAPTGITFSEDGSRAWVVNSHDFTVGEVDLTPLMNMVPSDTIGPNPVGVWKGDELVAPFDPNAVHTRPIRMAQSRAASYGADPMSETLQRGRHLFTYVFNTNLSRAFHFACNSCHPDGSEDGQVWIIPRGPRQTPQLAGRLHDTGPFNWEGQKDTLEGNVRATIDRMAGAGLPPDDMEALLEFIVYGLVRPLNPNRKDELTAAQKRGQALFDDPKVGCATCHSGPSQTDGLQWDVGTISPEELAVAAMVEASGIEGLVLDGRFDTPTLRDLFATAPYFHDSSAPTLMDIFDRDMGDTTSLSQSDKEDLVAYLLTL